MANAPSVPEGNETKNDAPSEAEIEAAAEAIAHEVMLHFPDAEWDQALAAGESAVRRIATNRPDWTYAVRGSDAPSEAETPIEFQCGWTTKGYSPCTHDMRQPGSGSHSHKVKKLVAPSVPEGNETKTDALAALRALVVAAGEEDPEDGWSESFVAAHSEARRVLASYPEPDRTTGDA